MPAWALHIRQRAGRPRTERKTGAPGTGLFAPGSPHHRWPCRPTRPLGWTCSPQADKRTGWEAPSRRPWVPGGSASHLPPWPSAVPGCAQGSATLVLCWALRCSSWAHLPLFLDWFLREYHMNPQLEDIPATDHLLSPCFAPTVVALWSRELVSSLSV